MLELFDRETSAGEKIGKENLIILKDNKNTRDDVEKSVDLAVAHGLTKIAFLLLEMRLERVKVFWEALKLERPDLVNLEVEFLSAEDFIREKYKKHPELIEEILKSFTDSKAFEKTRIAEDGGTKAIREKTYKGKGNY